MAWNPARKRARRALDSKLEPLRPANQFAAPHKGWIRAIRDSLGISSAYLGGLISVKSQSIDDMEKSEMAGFISLSTLRRVASALDCTLVYALVPNQPLEDIVKFRAQARAQNALGDVGHTMALEDQRVLTTDMEQSLVDDYIEAHISERDLWPRN